MNKTEKKYRALKLTGYISGLFTLFVAVIMILGYVQLNSIKPLENPSLIQLKEQYDANPNNEDLKEQVRALDLIARRAFFATQWQIETGTYLLILGALIFIFSQQMLIHGKRRTPTKPVDEFDLIRINKKARSFILFSSFAVVALAFIISFMLRKTLPNPLPVADEPILTEGVSQTVEIPASNTIVYEQEPADSRELAKNKTITESEISEQVEEVIKHSITDATSVAVSTGNYPFFRGEGSRGFAPEGSYPTSWDGKEERNIKWKIKVPKLGYSSPIIWGDKIFLTGAEGINTEVMCFNKNSGEIMWTASATGISGEPDKAPDTTEDTGLAAPTAATNGKVVCAIFATGNLVCLDFNGNRLWAKNLGVPRNHYGHSSSLIIHENKLLIQYDHFNKKSLIALDINTGNQLWETIRPVALSWASPVIATFDGVVQVILTSEPSVISYDINTGKELWNVKCMSGEVGPSVGVNSNYIFAVNDYASLVAIDPGKDAKIVWEDNEFTPEVSSPVATEKFVYILTSWGAVACYDSENGDITWQHDFDYGFYASPIVANNLVYMMDKAGVMHIIKEDREFTLLAEPKLGEASVCTPAFSDGKIYIRSEENLYCISK